MYVMSSYGDLDEAEDLAVPATQIAPASGMPSMLPVVGVLIAFTTSLVLISHLLSGGAHA